MAANNDQDAAAKKAVEETEAKKRKSFVAKCQVLLGGEFVPPGESMTLTREQFETLKGLGAVEGDWK
jgi:hypothetical protein